MGYSGNLIKVGEKNIYLIRGIFDYFERNNFERLKEANKKAEELNAELYIGLYSDKLLEKTNHQRKLKGLVSDDDRIFMLESIDFIEGAFIINSVKTEGIMESLKAKFYEKEYEKEHRKNKIQPKKYDIGYASGAFSNLHKGHMEHLKEMSEQCNTVIVAANSDNLIRNYKHKTVTVGEETRREILSHIKYVDMAVITDEYDKLKAIETVKGLCGKAFNAIFAGSDWRGDPKWDEFEKKLNKMGIDVVFTDRPENGISTTKIDGTKKKEERER